MGASFGPPSPGSGLPFDTPIGDLDVVLLLPTAKDLLPVEAGLSPPRPTQERKRKQQLAPQVHSRRARLPTPSPLSEASAIEFGSLVDWVFEGEGENQLDGLMRPSAQDSLPRATPSSNSAKLNALSPPPRSPVHLTASGMRSPPSKSSGESSLARASAARKRNQDREASPVRQFTPFPVLFHSDPPEAAVVRPSAVRQTTCGVGAHSVNAPAKADASAESDGQGALGGSNDEDIHAEEAGERTVPEMLCTKRFEHDGGAFGCMLPAGHTGPHRGMDVEAPREKRAASVRNLSTN
jgi:hypothetical protein